MVQATESENTAVIVQEAPSELRPVNVYAAGLTKGGLITTGVPPQELMMVSVPVDGGFTKLMEPLTSYCKVAVSQAVGIAVMPEIVQ
jgi:hypothetical protein